MLKHGLISDKNLWDDLIKIKSDDALLNEEMIFRTIRVKLDLVEADPVFFDQIAVPQRVDKIASSLDVHVQRFSKPDTTMRIKFME